MESIYKVVAQEFEDVNKLILQQLHSDVPLVETIGQYLVDAGGKRLRPLLVLLSSQGLGYKGRDHIALATIIEFLHTATLLHDDVVDTSDLRRGRSTANAKWGNAPSVLVGDFLYSRAFQLMISLGSMPIMEILSNATNTIAEGEVQQLVNCRDISITEEQYTKVIHHKTAMLFEAASHTGALLAGASPEHTQALKNYGTHLGLAFQLVDDALDYTGDAASLGKNVGDDLAEGKPTLPLIYTLKAGTADQKQLVAEAITNASAEKLEEIVQAVTDSGAIEYTMNAAKKESELALSAIQNLPESDYKKALIELAIFSTDRSF